MTLAALGWAAGAALLQWQAALPAMQWTFLLPVFALLAFRRPKAAFVCTFAMGFLWASILAHQRMAGWLAPELEGRDLQVVGVVSSLPAAGERGVRFELEIETVEGAAAGLPAHFPGKILLSWYRSPLYEDTPAILAGAVHPGERWLFTVRLRRPHGNVNPNGFDYEAWLLERGIGATGYMVARQLGYL